MADLDQLRCSLADPPLHRYGAAGKYFPGGVGMPMSSDGRTLAKAALGISLLALLATGVIFWLFVPSILLGLVAVALAVVARRRDQQAGQGAREMTLIALCLGAVSIVGTPWAALVASGAEDHGRLCQREPTNGECK